MERHTLWYHTTDRRDFHTSSETGFLVSDLHYLSLQAGRLSQSVKRVTEPKRPAGRGDTARREHFSWERRKSGTRHAQRVSTNAQLECVRSSMGKLRLSVVTLSCKLVRYSCSSSSAVCLSVCLSFFRLGLGQKLAEHAPTRGGSLDIYPLLLRPQGGLTHSRPMHRESIMPVLTPRALAAPRYWVPVDDEDLWCLARVESRSGGSVKLSRSRAPPGCVRVPHGLACRPYRAVRGMPCRVQRACTVPCRACRMDGRYHRRA